VAKQTLNKSINAKKLHPRTMTALPEHETTIPFAAVLDNIRVDRDWVTFHYLSEPYGCPRESLHAAVTGGIAKEPAATVAAAAIPAAPAPEPEAVNLPFEALSSNIKGLSRAKVPGGWLIASSNGGVTFYPDPDHSWDGYTSA